jgi:hypothetical protein
MTSTSTPAPTASSYFLAAARELRAGDFIEGRTSFDLDGRVRSAERRGPIVLVELDVDGVVRSVEYRQAEIVAITRSA